jgi:hypothetical protein
MFIPETDIEQRKYPEESYHVSSDITRTNLQAAASPSLPDQNDSIYRGCRIYREWNDGATQTMTSLKCVNKWKRKSLNDVLNDGSFL